MADWLSFEEAVEMVRCRLDVSVGRAQKIIKDAFASGEVRSHHPPVLLTADDGLVDFNLGPGPLKKRVMSADVTKLYLSKDDLLDWLNRHHPPEHPAATRRRAKARNIGECRKWLLELRKGGPQRKRKDDYKAEAMNRFGIGPDQFKTAWKTAALEIPRSDWGKSGRLAKKKSVGNNRLVN